MMEAAGSNVLTGCFGAGFIQRRATEEEKAPPTTAALRRLAQADNDVMERPRPAGLLARIFGRR